MILGFAHLAVNVVDLAEAEAVWKNYGYTRTVMYTNVPNHLFKERLLANYQPRHDLMLLSGEGLLPLELTWHGPTCAVNSQLKWDQDAIQIVVSDPDPLQNFFVDGLGFCEDNRGLFLNSRLSDWFCRVRLVAGESLQTSLSAAGPSCIAFYCNRIAEDAKMLIDLGATDFTNEFELTLGERDMTIAMMRMPGGPLLELINPRKKI